MTGLTKQKYFNDTGATDRSGENFQNQVFANIDFSERKDPINFFRADFRAVKMDQMKFFYNNFDRADFVNAFVTHSSFNACNWGTDFFNTVFEHTDFLGNIMDTCNIHKCYYKSCTFKNERVINTSNRDSTYFKCRFEGCTFEMNSFNDLHFNKCSFSSIDFANMGAYDLLFDNCHFKKVTMDPNYFGSYLFKNTHIDDIQFSYRGKDFRLSGSIYEDLQSLAIFFLENGRYYEAFNTTILFRHFAKVQVSIISYFEKIISLIKEENNNLVKQEQLNRIIKILIFYTNSDLLTSDEVFHFVGYLKDLHLQFFTISEKLSFLNNIDLLSNTVEAYLFDPRPTMLREDDRPIYAEIQIDEFDLAEFTIAMDTFFNALMLEANAFEQPGYFISGTRKGSLIVEIVGYAVGLYVLATILKSTVSKFFEIKIEYTLTLRAQKLIKEHIHTVEDLTKIAPQIRKSMAQPSDEVFKKAKPLANLMKQFHLFPNAFAERRKIG